MKKSGLLLCHVYQNDDHIWYIRVIKTAMPVLCMIEYIIAHTHTMEILIEAKLSST